MRYNRVMLTDKGRDLTRRTRALFDRLDEELFAGFTLNECEQLYGYLCRMTQNLAKEDFGGRRYDHAHGQGAGRDGAT